MSQPFGQQWLASATGKVRIEIDPHYFRPTEVDLLLGDPSLAKERLGWEPKVTFRELIRIMVDADVQALEERTDYRFR